MSIMGKMVQIPAGNTTNEHYNFVVAKPLVHIKVHLTQMRERGTVCNQTTIFSPHFELWDLKINFTDNSLLFFKGSL